MKVLTKEQDKVLLELLLEDRPFVEIRKRIEISPTYDIKSYCEYSGGKLDKAYKMHINNHKKINDKEILVQSSVANLSQEDFYKALLTLSKHSENKGSTFSITQKEEEEEEDIVDIIELPKSLPQELTGENYKVKQTSIKVIEGAYEKFNEFCKGNHYSKVELLSLALLEFIDKYRAK